MRRGARNKRTSERKARRMASPTERSLKLMRERGYEPYVVERWNAFAKCRIDLFGFLDLLCLGHNEIVGVQSCALSDVSKRIDKIANHKNVARVRKAGIRILVQGWESKKAYGKRSEVKFREVDVS